MAGTGTDTTARNGEERRVRRQPDDAEAEARVLLELAGRITGTLDLQDVLDQSLSALRELLPFNGGAIQLIEDDHLVAAATDPPISEEARSVRIPVGVGISGGIAKTARADYIPDLLLDERIPAEARKKGVSHGVRSYFGVPLIMQGRPIGVLQIDSKRVDDFSARDRALVMAFTPTISAAVQNARLFEAERRVSDRLLHADKLKRDFISIVSHELRTPLTIMLGMTGTLHDRAEELSPTMVSELAGRAGSAARRLRRLIDDLLYAAELDRGFLAVQAVPTRLGPILDQLRAEHADSPCLVHFDVPADLPLVVGDPDRINQVLSNLLGNAEKYCPAGTPVSIRTHAVGDSVVLEVEDHGPGIAEQEREAVFDLFYQASDIDQRDAEGLGIGLFVVRRLCDAMGVDISIEEVATGGTRFVLTFRTVGWKRD